MENRRYGATLCALGSKPYRSPCDDGKELLNAGRAKKNALVAKRLRRSSLRILVGCEWLEHSTYGLRVRCSTN